MKTQGEDGRPRAKDGGLGGNQEVADVWPPGPRDEETPVVQLPACGPHRGHASARTATPALTARRGRVPAVTLPFSSL